MSHRLGRESEEEEQTTTDGLLSLLKSLTCFVCFFLAHCTVVYYSLPDFVFITLDLGCIVCIF